MMRSFTWSRPFFLLFLLILILPGMAGCVATRNWVQEQIQPLAGRVSEGEARIGQTDAKVAKLGERLSGVEGQVGQVDSKAEQALRHIANLRLERKLVLDLREGANFAFNSAVIPVEARKEIDGFLSDLKGDPQGIDEAIFLIAGHTDSVGSEEYNYELGRRRAESVTRYLITQKKMDPLRVITVSYGQSAPLADNRTREGRSKNRRVEVLVYRDGITSVVSEGISQDDSPRLERPQQVSRR